MTPAIAALLVAQLGIAPPGTPYVQKFEYGSSAASTSHTGTWPGTPTNGNIMYVMLIADPGPVTTPAGWTRDYSHTGTGNYDLNVYRRTAGAGESTTVAFTMTSSDCAIIGFEWSTGFNTIDDNTTGGNNNAIIPLSVTGTFNSTGTSELFFGIISYATITPTVKTPFIITGGYTQIGYVLSVGVLNIELVVAYKIETTSGAKNFSISSTVQSAANSPWIYVSYQSP